MARQIIVLETNPSDGGYISVRAAFWFAIATARQVQVPTFKSQVSDVLAGTQALTALELTQLQSGAVLEQIVSLRFPNNFTTAQIKADLVAAYGTQAAFVAALPNLIGFYGVSYDGAAWSA